MEAKRRDPVRFFINALSVGFVILALFVAFQPYIGADARLEEVKRVEQQIKPIDPQHLVFMLKARATKPTMLVVYASWCSYCRRVMPFIVSMIRNRELDHVEPLFVSLDEQPRRLSQYLVHGNLTPEVFPYVMDRDLFKSVSGIMTPTGSSFEGVIPYIGFFTAEGRLITEVTGSLSQQAFSAMAAGIK